MQRIRKILLITEDPVPKPGKGGPGAVIDRISKELKSKLNEYKWFPVVISLSSSTKKRRTLVNIIQSILLNVLKNLRERSLVLIIQYKVSHNRILKNLISYIVTIRLLMCLSRYIKLLKKYNKEIRYADIIHCHDIFAMITLINFLKINPLTKPTPILLSIHSPGSTTKEILNRYPMLNNTRYEEILRSLELYAIRSATALIMPSYGTYQLLLNDLPELRFMRKKIFILYNGIKPIVCSKSKVELKNKFGVKAENIVIVSIGRLIHEKGFDILIKAIKCVTDNGVSNFHTLIIGEGPERRNIEKLIQALGLESKVRLLGRIKDISEAYSIADIFVSPSRRSAFDLVLLEALSASLPIVATDVGGSREAIGDAGILVRPGNPKVLCKALLKLIKDKRLRHELSFKAYKRFKERFHIETVAKSYVELLNSLV